METNWLWDEKITEQQAKAILSDTTHPQFIVYAARLLSRMSSAKEIFHDLLSRENFFVFWPRIKRKMRKDSWNDPRIDYWQAIYETLKKQSPELKELRAVSSDASFDTRPPVSREVGINIKHFREQSGFTQKDLAGRLGIAQQIISRIESGKQNISGETAYKIAKELGVSLEKLFMQSSPQEAEMQDEYVLLFPKNPDEFEEFCFRVINGSEEFSDVNLLGGIGDQGVDIRAFRDLVGGREKWYFQCKRYRKFILKTCKEDLETIKKKSESAPEFMPDGIVFIVACVVTPGNKTKLKEHARGLGFNPDKVSIWDGRELKQRAIDAKVDIPVPATNKDVERGFNSVIEHCNALMTKARSLPDKATTNNKEINAEIDEAVKSIHSNNIVRAKEELFTIRGKIEDDPAGNKAELLRIYTNLGVCFNRLEVDGGDLDKAEEFFRLALLIDSKFTKAKINLISTFLNKGGEKNYKKALEIANPLWEFSDKSDTFCFQVFIWAKYHGESPKQAIAYFEHSAETQALVNNDHHLLNLMGTMYLGQEDYKKAEEMADKALKTEPDSPAHLMLKARALMLRAQKEKLEPLDFEEIPKFRDYDEIEKAKELLEKALDMISNDNNRFLEAQIRYDLSICLFWLRFPEFADIIKLIDRQRLGSDERQQIEINNILWQISQRDFELAYSHLVNALWWKDSLYEVKARLAHIFLLRGAPEQARDIFNGIMVEAESRQDVRYWIDMSLIECLLGNKNLVISALQKVKVFALGTPKERDALSHIGAVLLRFARSDNEVDRFMKEAKELDAKYPDYKILQSVKVVDDNGQVSEDFKEIIRKQSDWYKSVKDSFQTTPVLSYTLEKILSRPYADVLSFRGPDEIDFQIELNMPDETFQEGLLDDLNKAEHLVFDYASLLNISKMNLLSLLERFKKRIYVSRKLFDKVQYELLMIEQSDLRNMWQFLRRSKELHVIKERNLLEKGMKYPSFFDEWLVDSIGIAKEKNAVFVVDDLRLAKFLRFEEKLKVCNSFVVLKSMLGRGWVDNKMYSTSIGDLAERFYIFLPFSGDDLFQIVMEDKSKVTLRSYHLVSQMFLPGSNAVSFTGVFVRFIDLLWKTGSLPEDKVSWLHFLTKNVLKLIDQYGNVQDEKELLKIVPDFALLWIVAIQRSSKDEILLLQKRVDKIFEAPVYSILKDKVASSINARKTLLGIG